MDYITIQDNTQINLHGFEEITNHTIIRLGEKITLRTADKTEDELLPSEFLLDFENGSAKHRFLSDAITEHLKDGKISFTFIDGVYYEL